MGRSEEEGRQEKGGGSSFLFNFWGAREGGRGSALGHRSALAIAQSRHIFPINEERTWISRPVRLRKGSGHPDGEGAGSLGEGRGLFPSARQSSLWKGVSGREGDRIPLSVGRERPNPAEPTFFLLCVWCGCVCWGWGKGYEVRGIKTKEK